MSQSKRHFNQILSPLVLIVLFLLSLNFLAFRWIDSRDKAKAATAIKGVLRNEYVTANSYALFKTISDLESLGILRCVVLIEKLEFDRTFYDTSDRSYCVRSKLIQSVIAHEMDLQAINGLTYKLHFQVPIRWQSLSLELMTYLMIITLSLLYQRHARTQALKQAVTDALLQQSRQVSHDIRSPLSALNMLTGALNELPEEKRLIIRNATQRINDIANGLLQRNRHSLTSGSDSRQPDHVATSSSEPVMLVALLDSIVSEKRLQYRERMEVEILAELEQGYGLFANIEASDFARIISNLVNNSVEALRNSGRVTVAIRGYKRQVTVIVTDNGNGIPPEILSRIGEPGVTYGKEGTLSGSGLGIFHARETMERAGGKLVVQSQVDVGTMITLTLPRAETPQWFIEKIELPAGATVVSADDDQTIHQIWEDRLLSTCPAEFGITHIPFTSLEQLASWTATNRPQSPVFLIDFEFLGQSGNGLDLIEQTGIRDSAYLVTSRYDEPKIRAHAARLGIKILPKSLAPFMPIVAIPPRRKFDAVLIDDDTELVHSVWASIASSKGLKIKMYSSPQAFLADADTIDRRTPIYVDVSLENGISGIDVSQEIHELGFAEIYLATGYQADSIVVPPFIRRVVGKDFPDLA